MQPDTLPFNLFSLSGRIALLTGAAGYLGRAMAEALTRAGAHVILNGRDIQTLDALAKALAAKGASVSVAAFDVTCGDEVGRAVETIRAVQGKLHILVNNAYAGKPGTLETARPEDFLLACNSAVTAAFCLARQTRPLLEEGAKDTGGGASVINISSMYGVVSPDPRIYGDSGLNNPPFYGAAKAGLLQLTRYMACHWARLRIRVNAISPGPFPRPEFLAAHPEFHGELTQKTPLGRVGSPVELQGPIVFLASDASSFVTGANLSVDGGWTAW